MKDTSEDARAPRCLTCGYLLRGLDENRCSECGREFDLHDAMTMDTPAYRQRVRLAYWLPAVVLGLTFFSMFMLPRILPYEVGHFLQPDGQRLRQIPWFGLSLFAAWSIRTRARRAILWPLAEPNPKSEKWGRRMTLVGAIAAVMFSWGTRSWSCPHGDSIQFGPFVVTRFSDNGPCDNYSQIVWRCRIGEETFFSISE